MSSELWEPSGRSDSYSLGDMGAASEKRQRMIWALKDVPRDKDGAYFVLGA